MAPPGDSHCAIEAKITADLVVQGERRRLGKVRCGEVAIILWRRPDRVVGADAVFISNDSLPIRRSPEGYLETIPDLVAEVVSKNDTEQEIHENVRDYLKAGVRVVWVADPSSRTVTAHRRGRKPKIFKEGDVVTVPDVIPDFQMTVHDVFEE
jgi:Uma2 family endonuclease